MPAHLMTQASLPGGERHAAVGTEYLQSVATMVSIPQLRTQLPGFRWRPALLQLMHQKCSMV